MGKKTIVKGTAVDKGGESIIGANIMEQRSTSNGTITDVNGRFTLSSPSNSVLAIMYVGSSAKNVPMDNQSTVQIVMEEDSEVLKEVTVVAYSTQKKIPSTAAVSSVKTKNVAQKLIINTSNSLTGRMAGVIIKQGSRESGADGPGLRARGVATLRSQSPLVVVNRVPRGFLRIDSGIVEDITILKGVATITPYGMAGASKTVLVTIRKGKGGAPVLSYNGYTGFQNPTRITNQVNSYEYTLMKDGAAMNVGYSDYYAYSQHDLEMCRKTYAGNPGADPDRCPNNNGLCGLIQSSSVITNHNLQLSGSSSKLQYYVSLGRSYQEGMWSTTDYQRFNLLTNSSIDATRYTKISLSLGGRHEKRSYPGADTDDIMYQAYCAPPVFAIQYSNDLQGQYVGKSLFELTYRGGYRQESTDQLDTSFFIEQQLPFTQGLSIKGVINYDPYRVKEKKYLTSILVYALNAPQIPYQSMEGFQGPERPDLEQSFEESVSMTYQGMISYSWTFDKHTVYSLYISPSPRDS